MSGKSAYELAQLFPDILELFEAFLLTNEERENEKKKIVIQKTKPKEIQGMFKKTEPEAKSPIINKVLWMY